MRHSIALCLAALTAACSTAGRTPLPAEVARLEPAPAFAVTEAASAYRIGVGDVLNVTVFRVPELTVAGLRVDSAGFVQLPLLGSVAASGMTADELGADLQSRLGERYLRDPQVSVSVSDAASLKITVDGAVNKPGVYTMRGQTSLLQAVAMAEGPTRVASLDDVAVFRTVNGRRAVAIFNIAEIRRGTLQDPYLQGDDVVIVDSSRFAVAFRDIIQALPGLGIFAYF